MRFRLGMTDCRKALDYYKAVYNDQIQCVSAPGLVMAVGA